MQDLIAEHGTPDRNSTVASPLPPWRLENPGVVKTGNPAAEAPLSKAEINYAKTYELPISRSRHYDFTLKLFWNEADTVYAGIQPKL
jgi:hypothetical protein